LVIVVSMILAPRPLRGVATTRSPGNEVTGAGQGHGEARPFVTT
jgi:hypothetical protein